MAGLIKRGEIWIADLDPGFGTEIRKKRPVLVIASDLINHNLNTTIVVPISSQVSIPGVEKVFLRKATHGLNKQSVILPVFVRAVDKVRLVKKAGKITQDKLEEVEDSLRLVLGMIEFDR